MKTGLLQKVYTFAFVVAALTLFANNYSLAAKGPAEPNYLSVRQSLIPMFSTRLVFPFNRINPDIRPYILFYLEKDNYNDNIVAKGIWLLGFVGQEEDVQFIDRYIQSFLKSPDYKHLHPTTVAGAAGAFAGMMMKRDIKGAKQFFVKYGNVAAWMPPKESPEIVDAARRDYSHFIMGAYQYSKADFILPLLRQKSSGPRPFSHESFVDAFEKMEVDKYTKFMKPSPTPKEKLDENIAKLLGDYGEMIDMLLRKQTYAQWRKAHLEKQKTVSRAEKKTVDSVESIDMSETVEGGYLKVIAGEAAKAYMQTSRMLLDRDAKDLPIKKEILQDIQKAGLNNYDGFQIRIEVEAKINDFVPVNKGVESKATVPVVVKEKETAAVTFNIRDTAYIFKRHFTDAGDNSLTSSTTGDVIINMKRINDKWYWSPASDSNVSAVADIVEDNYLIDSVSEAIIAYTQIARMIIDGNYDPLVIPVLDNCKLIPLKKRKKDKDDEMAEALDIEKRILEDVIIAKLNNYGDFHVKVEFEAALNNFVPAINGVHGNEEISAKIGAMPVIVKGYETAIVTFIIRDTADIFKKYIPRVSDATTIDDETGDLKVYMKRINGKWHWNPFGW